MQIFILRIILHENYGAGHCCLHCIRYLWDYMEVHEAHVKLTHCIQ